MKKSILFFALVLALNVVSAQQFQFMPTEPQPGDLLSIEYNPIGTSLEGEEVHAVAYVLELGKTPNAFDVALEKSAKGYRGAFKSPKNAHTILFKFENELGTTFDNNNEAGYYTMMYANNQPLEKAYASVSTIYGMYAGLLNVKADEQLSMDNFNRAMGDDPSQKLSDDYISQYINVARANKNEAAKANVIEHIQKSIKDSKITEEDLSKYAGFARSLGDKDLSTSIAEQIKSMFPNGKSATIKKLSAFRTIETLDEQVKMYNESFAQYGNNDDYQAYIANMARTLARSYGEKEDFVSMEKYVAKLSKKSDQAGVYNNLAWGCTGESLEGKGHHLKEGEKISKKSLVLLEEAMSSLEGKPEAYSARQWKNVLNGSYGMYADTYALLAYKLGDTKNAFKYQAISCKLDGMRSAEMNERYAVYMEEDQGSEKAMAYLEEMIGEGTANSNMKKQFSKLFTENVTIDQASVMYMEKLEAKAKAIKIEKIKEEMIKKEAPAFALTNLKGENVSLESLKGKVVVVDFWATWCGPCKASFPGMQKAVNKYNDKDDVAFVFIDTWENGDKKEENAQKFIDGKGYTFNVLMDNKNKMVADYGVSGIPTKFILDKEGNIRFESSGFNGNDDDLVDEISIVVEILRGSQSDMAKVRTTP